MRRLILLSSLVLFAACGDFSTTIRDTEVTLTPNRTSAPVGQPIEFRYAAQGRSLAGLVIEYGDFSNPDSVSLQGAVTATGFKNHSFANAGAYVVTARLEEFLGKVVNASVTVNITRTP